MLVAWLKSRTYWVNNCVSCFIASMNEIMLKRVQYKSWFCFPDIFTKQNIFIHSTFISEDLNLCSTAICLTVCLLSKKSHLATFSVQSHHSINLTQILRCSLSLECSNSQTTGVYAVSMYLGHHTELLSQAKRNTVRQDSKTTDWWSWGLNQAKKQSWQSFFGFWLIFFWNSAIKVLAQENLLHFSIILTLVYGHDYKMTDRSMHGCNDVFGVQEYHITDTGWLKKDRKSST